MWTCARIAAHPVEATRAGVSCKFSGDNGTTPRHIPETPPSVDPALLGFVDGYRQALASGSARRIGEGTVDGQHVIWLEFRLPTATGLRASRRPTCGNASRSRATHTARF